MYICTAHRASVHGIRSILRGIHFTKIEGKSNQRRRERDPDWADRAF